MVNLVKEAKEYLAEGFSVIPIQAGTKKPAIAWKEFQTRRMTEEEVAKHFSNCGGIGIVTGAISNLIVIDIDSPYESDFLEVYESYKSGYVVKTPRGGKHIYFFYDGEAIGNSVNKLMPHVDVRGEGGYVVAPPTEGYTVLKDGSMAILTSLLANSIIVATKEPVTIEITENLTDDVDLYNHVLINGFTEGQHNVQLLRLARYLFRSGMPEPIIVSTLKFLNAKDSTPQDHKQLLATIHNGIEYERKRLQKDTSNGELTSLELEPLDSFLAEYSGHTEKWLIKDMLPEGAIVMLSALPEMGKTWLGLEMACCVALGKYHSKPFMGYFPVECKASPVLIFQQEDALSSTASRIAAVLQGVRNERSFSTNSILWNFGGRRDLVFSPYIPNMKVHTQHSLTFDTMHLLKQAIIDTEAKLVFIDPFYSLGGSTEDYFAGAAVKLKILQQLRDELGCTFILVHHNNKTSAGSGARTGVFGSVFMSAAVECVVVLYEADGEKKLTRSGKRFATPIKGATITIKANTKALVNSEGEVAPDNDDDSPAYFSSFEPNELELGDSLGSKIIILLSEGTPLTRGQIATTLGVKENGGPFTRALNALVEANTVSKPDKRGGKYYLVSTH